MGTRLWYAMWSANDDDDAAFERRVNPVLKEIGDRCKVVAAEGRQQLHEPTPAPSPAPTLPAARAPALTIAGGAHGSSPRRIQQREHDESKAPAVTVVHQTPSADSSMASGSFAEMAAFFREEREQFREERAQFEAKLEAQRQLWEARLEAQRQELEKVWEAKLEAQRSRRDASEARLLQARFEALHASKLLSDDELYILENLVVDNLEESERSGGEGESNDTVNSLVRLSEHVASDAGLAWQLRRKSIWPGAITSARIEPVTIVL